MNWATSMLSVVIVGSSSLVIVKLVCCAGCPVRSQTEIPYTRHVVKFTWSTSTSSRQAYSKLAPSRSAFTTLVRYKRASLRSALLRLQRAKSELWIRAPTSVALERSAAVNRDSDTIASDNCALSNIALLRSQNSRIQSARLNPDRSAAWKLAPVKLWLPADLAA